mgnify:CR=1 FL=1
MPAPLDERARHRHKWRNRIQSLLLIGGLIGLLALCVWVIFGPESIPWVLVGGALGLLLGPRASPKWVLSMYGARRIEPRQSPELHSIVQELARRAGLSRAPELHYLPSATLNAFAVGSREDAAIAVSDGLLRRLDLRELAGVLAHEISHVRNNDLWVMGLADMVSRLTSLLSYLGMFLLFLALPMLLTQGGGGHWLLAGLLLTFAPTLGSLLQLALSRAREFEADLDGAGLTGDPRGLAAALTKLERWQGRFWEEILLPGRRMPVPSMLRTHPPTAERVRRLLSLYGEAPSPPFRAPLGHAAPQRHAPLMQPPRWRRSGAWY